MATAVRTQSNDASKTQKKQFVSKSQQEPKRLSKFALWRRENHNGILECVDWRAANR